MSGVKFACYTIELPDGSAFDAWVVNSHESTAQGMSRVVELAGCSSYITHERRSLEAARIDKNGRGLE